MITAQDAARQSEVAKTDILGKMMEMIEETIQAVSKMGRTQCIIYFPDGMEGEDREKIVDVCCDAGYYVRTEHENWHDNWYMILSWGDLTKK